MTPDPWESIEKEYPVGSVIEGEVSRITNFGAFIRLPIGVEGLVHISELSEKPVEKVEDVLKLGDKKQFRVINVNRNERRLGLSLKPAKRRSMRKRQQRKPLRRNQQRQPKVEQAPMPQSSKPKGLLQLELEKLRHGQDDESGSRKNE